jgi:hypothetical protein
MFVFVCCVLDHLRYIGWLFRCGVQRLLRYV